MKTQLIKSILAFCILYFLFSIITNAQSPALLYSIAWQKFYGGSMLDENDYLNNTIAATPDGGYIFTGDTWSNDGDVSGNHGLQDAWVCKIDATGNIQWQKCLGGSDWDWGQNIITTSDGGYLVGCATNSNDGDVTGYHGKGDILLVKLNAAGNVQWKKTLGSSKYDDCADIMQNPDGTYMFAGLTEGNNGDVSGNHGKSDAWVVKLDQNGNILWQKCYGGSNDDGEYHTTEIIPSIEGGYLLATVTSSSGANVTGFHGKPGKKWNSTSSDLADAWLVKLDVAGNIQWQKCFGGPNWDFFENIIQTSSGDYIGSGGTLGAGGDIPGNNGTTGSTDWWVAKISQSGNVVWSRNYGGTGQEAIHGRVFELANGDLILPSGTRSNDHDCIGMSGAPDLWIVKTDALGNILSYNVWGGSGYENLSYALMNNDASLTVAAMIDSTNGDFQHDEHADFMILKLVPNPADTFAITTTSLSQSVTCPNYSSFSINVSFSKRGTFNTGNIFTAELSDAEGNFVAPITVGTLNSTTSGNISCVIPGGLPSGKYYSVRIRSSHPLFTGISSGHLLNVQSCATPTELSTSNLTSTGIQLKWNPVPCAIQYKLQYSKSPNASWSNANTVSTTDTSANISGLNSSSTYFWRVQSKCSGSPNVWSDVSLTKSFTTFAPRMGEITNQSEIIISPNPFANSTTIFFSLSQSGNVSLKIFDLNRRLIKTLADNVFEEGEHQIDFNAEKINAGIYFLQFQSAENLQTEKLIVTK